MLAMLTVVRWFNSIRKMDKTFKKITNWVFRNGNSQPEFKSRKRVLIDFKKKSVLVKKKKKNPNS